MFLAVAAFVLWVVFSLILWLAHSKGIVLPHPDPFDRGQRGPLWPFGIYRDENAAWFWIMVGSYWIAWVLALVVFAYGLSQPPTALPN